MFDLEILRNNPKKIEEEIKKRGLKGIKIKDVLKLDKDKREAIAELDNLRSEQKKISANISKAGILKKRKLISQAKSLANKISDQEPIVKEKTEAFIKEAALLPNLAHESVPEGKSDKDNKVEAVYGEKPLFDFPVKAHWQIAHDLDLIDNKRAARLSGSRFNYLKGDLVRLEFALLRFALDEIAQKGFTPMLTPTLVKEEAMYGSGMFPIDKNEVYKIDQDNLYLIGTAEISLLNYHAHEIINIKEKPLLYAGFTTNYRREAGAYGKDIKGLIRQHQFDKLELFAFISQEQSWDYFEKELINIPEELLKKLGLHYRKVTICLGDLPRKFKKTYDLEVWLPSEKRYLETHSISHAGDYQSRRLGIKYLSDKRQRRYVHTLNATALAFSRMPVVILENFQQADGRVLIPEVLQPYMNNQEYLTKQK